MKVQPGIAAGACFAFRFLAARTRQAVLKYTGRALTIFPHPQAQGTLLLSVTGSVTLRFGGSLATLGGSPVYPRGQNRLCLPSLQPHSGQTGFM